MNSSKIVRNAFESRPADMNFKQFVLSVHSCSEVAETINFDIGDSCYSALVTFAEAVSGLTRKSYSWSAIKLYYCCFYCMRSLLLSECVVPFVSKQNFMYDGLENRILMGGKSSHNWSWSEIKKIGMLNSWYFSQDSFDAYDAMREDRELANYRSTFKDPECPRFMMVYNNELSKYFKTYRDDDEFFYTYLDTHRIVAYPVRLIFALDKLCKERNINLDDARRSHINKIWKLQHRCPFF